MTVPLGRLEEEVGWEADPAAAEVTRRLLDILGMINPWRRPDIAEELLSPAVLITEDDLDSVEPSHNVILVKAKLGSEKQ